MIQINSIIAVLAVELGAALLLVLLVSMVVSVLRKGRAKNAATTLIQKVTENESPYIEELGSRLAEASGVDRQKMQVVLAEIGEKEKALFRQIIKLFLDRDTALLAEIDQHVRGLSGPYCTLVERSRQEAGRSQAREYLEDEGRTAEINSLEVDNQRLTAQLSATKSALDDVSREYTQMFGQSKSADELESSRQEMLAIYENAEKNLSKAFGAEFAKEFEMIEV